MLKFIPLNIYLLNTIIKKQVMKKVITIIVAFLAFSSVYAGDADLFNVNEQAIQEEFADLNALEEFVVTNDYLALTDIVESNAYDLSAINVNTMGASSSGDFAFQIEGFLWGFLCCPIGFFVVAVNKNKDRDQKLSYWIGVAASTVVSAITSPIYYSTY